MICSIKIELKFNYREIVIDEIIFVLLESSCSKKRQKSPGQETGLGNRRCLKFLNDTKLVLNEHE